MVCDVRLGVAERRAQATCSDAGGHQPLDHGTPLVPRAQGRGQVLLGAGQVALLQELQPVLVQRCAAHGIGIFRSLAALCAVRAAAEHDQADNEKPARAHGFGSGGWAARVPGSSNLTLAMSPSKAWYTCS